MEEEIASSEPTISFKNDNDVDSTIDRFDKALNILAICIEDIPKAILNPMYNEDVDKLRLAFRSLRKNTIAIIDTFIAAKRRDADRIANLERNYGEIYSKWQNEKKKAEKSELQIAELLTQTRDQSNFCTNLGAVLGNFLWKSSKFPQIINTWSNENQSKMAEFLSIVNTTFTSFIDTFNLNFPPLRDNESQFVISLLGTTTNISSTELGRQFISDHRSGKILIKQLVTLLPLIPKEHGDATKRLILMILYNISLNRVGLPFLLELKIEEYIGPNLTDETIALNIQAATLRIIQSLTYNLTNPHILQRIIDVIPFQRIQLLATLMNSEHNISKIAQEVIDNIINSRASADTASEITSSTDNN